MPFFLSDHLQNIDIALDDSIGSAISVFVPRISRANLDVGSLDHSLDFLNLGEELFACEVAAVECLGADGDGIDLVWELGGICGDGFLVGAEGGFYIGPRNLISPC